MKPFTILSDVSDGRLRRASRSCSRGRRVEKRALRIAVCDPRWVPNPARPSRCGRALPLSRVTRVRGRGERDARPPTAGNGTSGVGGRRDAEHAAAVRSRKARAAIRRGDFMPCDPRRSQRLARRIGAPDMCRPPASLVAARAPGYEPRAISRRAERRRPSTVLVRCSSAGPTKQ